MYTASTPQPKDLHNLVTPRYAVHWRDIGTQLGLRDELLGQIDYDNCHKSKDCCNAVWTCWLRMDTKPSWSKVIDAIESPSVVSTAKASAEVTVSAAAIISNVSNQLQEFYVNERYKTLEDDWPSYQPEHFTSVALIHHREKHITKTEVFAIASAMHKGEVNIKSDNSQSQGYFSMCTSTREISELFLPLHGELEVNAKPNMILIEGAPGIGKTIFSKEIAFKWAKRELLTDKMLLFLIYLRDPHIQKIESLEQFICYAINASSVNSKVKAIEEYLEDTSGKHCTIVFDGYDEVPNEIRYKSFISKLIGRKVLSLCCLVITSRPTVSAQLHGIVDIRVEILGFTKEDREDYIYQSLKGNVEEIKKIQEYFKTNTFISSLCYIPLNMTILMCLLKSSLQSGHELPQTQTEINYQFALLTVSRYLKKEFGALITTNSLRDLPSPYKDQFYSLCKLAFRLLDKEKVAFDYEDIRAEFPQDISNFRHFGLLKVVKYCSYPQNIPRFSYNFLHFSLQEFLAAYYMSSSKKVTLLPQIFWNPRYLNTTVMYVGLTKERLFALKHFLSGRKSVLLSKVFGTRGIATDILKDTVKCLHLFQCFVEAGNTELMQKVGGFITHNTIDLSGNTLLPKDIHTLSFFLSRSTVKYWEILNLSMCYMGDNGFDTFCKDFIYLKEEENNLHIKYVNLSYNHLTHASVSALIKLISCFRVNEIVIDNNEMEILAFNDVLFTSTINGSQLLLRVNSNAYYFINTKHITQPFNLVDSIENKLYFWNSLFQFKDIDNLVSNNARIKIVSVYNEAMIDEDVGYIASRLKQLHNFEVLCSIEYVLLSQNKMCYFNTNMTKIHQSFASANINKQESMYQHNLFSSKLQIEWKVLDICHCQFNDGDIKHFVSCVVKEQFLTCFDTFSISQCQLTSSSANTIIQILKCCVIKYLIVSDNHISNICLRNVILPEICIQSDMQNFKHGFPLLIFSNFSDYNTENISQSTYCITKYFVNCEIDLSIQSINFENPFIMHEIFLFHTNLSSEHIEMLCVLCNYSSIKMNIYERNLVDETATKLSCNLLNSNVDHTFALTSDTKLVSYKVAQQQINEVLDSSKEIMTVVLRSCKLQFNQLNRYRVLFGKVSRHWNHIDFSDCNIGDSDCDLFCKFFSPSDGDIYIKCLTLSQNCISSSFVVKLLSYMIIEKLQISQNPITDDEIHNLLCAHYFSGGAVLNFDKGIPLGITVSLQLDEGVYASVCSIYIEKCSLNVQSFSFFLSHPKSDIYNFFIVDDNVKAINTTIFYSSSWLKIAITDDNNNFDMVKQIMMALKINQKRCFSKIEISGFNIEINLCSILSEMFNKSSLLKYVNELSIGDNLLTVSCLNSIFKSLQFCIINKLVFSINDIEDSMLIDVIIMQFLSNSILLNFTHGIPLTIVQCAMTPADKEYIVMLCIKGFSMNGEVGDLFLRYSDCKITAFRLFLIQSHLMVEDLNHAISLLHMSLLTSNAKLFVLEPDLTNYVAPKVYKHIMHQSKLNVEYIIMSGNKLFVHTCLLYTGKGPLLLKRILEYNSRCWKMINMSGCCIGNERCTILLDYLALNNDVHYNVDVLDISDNNLTSTSTVPKLLCCCIIKKFIVSGNLIVWEDLYQNIVDLHQAGNSILNFVHNVPLLIEGVLFNNKQEEINCNIYTISNSTLPTKVKVPVSFDKKKTIIILLLDNKVIETIASFDLMNNKIIFHQLKEDVIVLLEKITFLYQSKYCKLIDISDIDINDKVCGVLCRSFFNNESMLNHVKELDISSANLTNSCVAVLMDSLHYCCIDKIIVSADSILEKITSAIFSAKSILNFVLQRPLTGISCTEVVQNNLDTWETLVSTYFTYFSKEKIDQLFETLLVDHTITKSHQLIFLNCYNANQTTDRLNNFISTLTHPYITVLVYQVGVHDEIAYEITEHFKPQQQVKVQYFVLSKSMMLINRLNHTLIIEALQNNSFISTLELVNCTMTNKQLADATSILASKHRFLKNLTIRSFCSAKDFLGLLFNTKSILRYLKKLDISHNYKAVSVNSLVASLHFCIIERIIISDSNINAELSNCIFHTAYYGRGSILNFAMGVPLIVIKSVQDKDSSTNMTIFIVNCNISCNVVEMVTDTSGYPVSDCDMFICKKNVVMSQSSHFLSIFQNLLQKFNKFTLFGADLLDNVAVNISKLITESTTGCVSDINYLLLSTSKVISSLTSIDLISKLLLSKQILITPNCHLGEELFGMLCKSFYSRKIKELDLSSYQLTLFCVNALVDSLQYCSVEKLIVNSNEILEKINEALLVAHFPKIMHNFISRSPLEVTVHIQQDEFVANLYFIDFKINEKFENVLTSLLNSTCYTKLTCAFLNFLQANQDSAAVIYKCLSDLLTKSSFSLLMHEIRLEDKVILRTVDQLKRIREKVQYILSSKSMLFAFKTSGHHIVEVLTDNYSVATFEAIQCRFSKTEFHHIGNVLSTECIHLRNLTFSQCYIDNTGYMNFSNSLFSSNSVITYLRKLDLSHNHLTRSSVSAVIKSLQFCIIEKLIISDSNINDELFDYIFFTAYYGTCGILNFAIGVPLIIFNSIQGSYEATRLITQISNFSVFVVNAKINAYTLKQITDISNCEISDYSLFLFKNNVMIYDLGHVLSYFRLLFQMDINFTLFVIDLINEIALEIVHYLNKLSPNNVQFFLVADRKIFVNMKSIQLILKMLTSNERNVYYYTNFIGEEMFSVLCNTFPSNDQNLLEPVIELDISSYQLSAPLIAVLIKFLQHCCIKSLVVSDNNSLDKVTFAIFNSFCVGKVLQNFASEIPLTVAYSLDSKIKLYFQVKMLYGNLTSESFENILKNYDKLFFINCLSTTKWLLNIYSLMKVNTSIKIMMYEVNLQDETLLKIIEQLNMAYDRVQYVVISKSFLFAYRIDSNYINQMIVDGSFSHICSFKAEQCYISSEVFEALACTLSSKCAHLKSISLSQCCMHGETYKLFSNLLFNHKSVISYLKKLDISHTKITLYCIRALISSFYSCVIETLVIPENSLNEELVNYVFLTTYSQEKDILNFVTGVPLIVINSENMTIFIVNCNISCNVVDMVTDTSGYPVPNCDLFICKNNVMISELSHYLSIFQNLLQKFNKFTLFGADLMDNVAVNISKLITESTRSDIEYLLLSTSKVISSLTSIDLISKLLINKQVLINPNCHLGEELFGMLCKSFYSSQIKELDLTSYQLTLFCVNALVDSLQYCSVEKLIVNSNEILEKINEALLAAHFPKIMHNSISGSPLEVTFPIKQDEFVANLYFIDFKINEKFENVLTSLLNSTCYTKLTCAFLNFLQANKDSAAVIYKCLSDLLTKSSFSLLMREIGLEDKVVLRTVDQLKRVREKVQYILSSKSMLFAFKASGHHIVEVLTDNYSVATFEAIQCRFSNAGFHHIGNVLSTECIHLRNLTFSQCYIDNTDYMNFSNSLFSSSSVITYLRKLDLSHSYLTWFSIYKITKSLQSCITENIIVSGAHNIYYHLVSSISHAVYGSTTNIINFTIGVPLVIFCSLQNDGKFSTKFGGNNQSADKHNSLSRTVITKCTIFLINTVIDRHIVSLITDMSAYNILDYIMFINNNVLMCNFNNIIARFEHLLKNILNFTVFGANLMDSIAVRITNCLQEAATAVSIFYFLASETKILPSFKLPEEKLIRNIFLNKNDTFSELKLLSLFCLSLSSPENSLKHIKHLDLSCYHLTEIYAKKIVDSLQYCCVENIKIANYTNITSTIVDYIFHRYFMGITMYNTILRVPLKLIIHNKRYNHIISGWIYIS